MKVKKSARDKIIDYLAISDHSRQDLTTKLQRLEYSENEIAHALDAAEAAGWLLSNEKMAAKVTEALHRKNKGYLYIVQYLEAKGLPPLPIDAELELEKAQKLLQSHFSKLSKSNPADKNETDKIKIAQFLKNRGFDTQTVAKIIGEF